MKLVQSCMTSLFWLLNTCIFLHMSLYICYSIFWICVLLAHWKWHQRIYSVVQLKSQNSKNDYGRERCRPVRAALFSVGRKIYPRPEAQEKGKHTKFNSKWFVLFMWTHGNCHNLRLWTTVTTHCVNKNCYQPGRNTSANRLHSSLHQHCRTLHSNLVPKIVSLAVF